MRKGKDHKLLKLIRTIKKCISDLCKEKNGKMYLFLQIFLSVIDSLIPLVYVVLPGLIINELTAERNFEKVFIYVLALCCCPIISHIKNITLGIVVSKLRMRLIRQFEIKFQDHVSDMDYETLEKPEIRVLKQRVGINAPAPIYMMDRLIPFLIAIFNTLLLSSIVFLFHPLIIILIIGVLIINSVVTSKINKRNFENKKRISKHYNSYYTHFFDLSDTASAKEIRLYDIKDFFIKLFSKEAIYIDQINLQDEKYRKFMQSIHIITGFLQQFVLYSFLIYSVVNKDMAIGTMTIYLASVEKFSGALTSVFNRYLDIGKFNLEVDEYNDFTSIPSLVQDRQDRKPFFESTSIIEFRNVSFKYPGSEKYAIKGLNLKIFGNKKLCIVGENGSGKTTFIKLLTRLYKPTEGDIFLNGININDYDIVEYRKIFSPVFQDFYLYNLSIASNIALEENIDKKKLEDALNKSGVNDLVKSLQNGYDTQVMKNIDPNGIEPSGGEGQKIAIARALYHQASIFLLDEPTAALDPNAEYEIYLKFSKMITNKAAVLITHRLSAVQLADEVAVFEDGRIAEYGTHAELYKKNGIYTEMFDKQAGFYLNNNENNKKK